MYCWACPASSGSSLSRSAATASPSWVYLSVTSMPPIVPHERSATWMNPREQADTPKPVRGLASGLCQSAWQRGLRS